MNTEKRLATAEELLRQIVEGFQYMSLGEVKVKDNPNWLSDSKEFLNPKPEIDWSQVPVGTQIKADKYSFQFYTVEPDDCVISANRSIFKQEDCTIPPQPSHIHKCPWPEDGRPEWVNDEDFIVRIEKTNEFRVPVKAAIVDWYTPSKYFAVLKIAEYWK